MSNENVSSGKRSPRDLIRETMSAALAAGDLVEAHEFRLRLGLTQGALADAEAQATLFGIPFEGRRLYPGFFLDQHFDQAALQSVARLLAPISAGARYLFFTSRNAYLADAQGRARTPLEALQMGDLERVRRAAAGYADR